MLTSDLAVDYAVSADGTRIGFERVGAGPGLVLIQGAMGTAYNFRELAEALADSFTVVVPDRRGRGLSPRAFSPGFTIDDDVRDLDAVLQATGASYVFGLSSGGDIALRAALTLSQIDRIALFEPAIFLDGVPRKGAERLEAYFASGDLAGILVAGMKLAGLGPALLRSLPDWMVKPAVGHIMKQEAKSGSGNYASMADLALAFRYDFVIVGSMDGSVSTFQAITQPALLLGGSESPAYLGRALAQLERVIPNVRRVQLDGLDHAAPWNVDERRNPRGNPRLVAEQLTAFFQG